MLYGMGNGFVVPSLASAKYKANRGTTIAAYKALRAHIAHFTAFDRTESYFPVLCFFDPDDELVDIRKLGRLISTKQLRLWEIVTTAKDRKTATEKYHHVTIDSDAVDQDTWEIITGEIERFLQRQGIIP